MAITRAQQVKQMLQDGGRIGFRGGDAAKAERERSGKNTSRADERGGVERPGRGGDTSNFIDPDPEVNIPTRNRQDTITSFTKNLGANLRSNPFSFLTPIGTGIKTALQTNQARKMLGYTSPTTPTFNNDRGDNNMEVLPLWAQLGFNSEAEYLASLAAQQGTETEDQDERFLAFRAEGGRIGLQEGGGIEQRLEQLGGDVSSAEQLLQGINKRLQTAESSLGSGGGQLTQLPAGGTLATVAGASQPAPMSEERMNSLGRSAIGNGFYDFNRGLNNLQPALPGVGPNVGNEIAQPNAPFMGRPILQPLLDQPLGQPLPATLETAQPGPNPFGIINSLTDSRGPAFDTMENAYKNAVDSSAEMKRIGRLDQLDVLGGRLNFEDYKKNFSMNDEGFVTRNPGSTPLGMQSQGASGVPALGFADGGRIGAAEGGIMDLETGRQMYFLGKLVKKATRAVKKVAKSPIGKAALLYAGAGALSNLAAGSGLTGMFTGFTNPSSFLAKEGLKNIFTKKGLGNILVGGKTQFGERARDFTEFSGLFGKGGELNPFRAITAVSAVAGALTPQQEEEAQQLADNTGFSIEEARNAILQAAKENYAMDVRARGFKADGGIMRAGYQEGSKEPVAKKTMPLLDMGGKEMDLREDGGFVPIGRMEKADDVPARLSKNEFVFTADAVRNAGDGNVDKGAEVMYNMMKNLESGGDVSEESQGLSGARRMFQTSQRLEEVL